MREKESRTSILMRLSEQSSKLVRDFKEASRNITFIVLLDKVIKNICACTDSTHLILLALKKYPSGECDPISLRV
jgi:hypothetical protein